MSDNDARPRSRRKSFIAAQAGLLVLASTSIMVGTASSANAAAVPCPAGLSWHIATPPGPGQPPLWAAETLSLVSSQPDFQVAEQREVENDLSVQAQGSFTSSVSKTFTLTVNASVGGSLFGFLTANVSSSISMSTTTQTGVTATGTIAPFGRLIGQFGVFSYDVVYNDNRFLTATPTAGGSCQEGSTQYSTVAPTVNSGWRLTAG